MPRQFVVIREATEVVLRHLERLPPSDRRAQLCVAVEECMQEIEMWSASARTLRELDALMKRVLALHIEVTKLERNELAAEHDAPTSCSGSAT